MENYKHHPMWRLFFVVCMLWFGASAWAQNVTTTGTVSDENGETLIGVTVLVEGTTHGTTTDLDGNYKITAKQGSKLVFSYVGMQARTLNAVNGTLNVTLKSANSALNEVVVVGYGVQKKSDVTGAISKVDGDMLENLTVNNPTAALSGKTSGVQVVSTGGAPGASPTIRVRGYSSNSDMAPLYVVDGVRISDISGIDPSQIESIEVLKDGASAAIYGSQAGNGVVLITTKSAKNNGKWGSVRYDFQWVNETVGHRPKMLNAEQYKNYILEAGLLKSDFFDKNYDGFTDTDWFDAAFEHGNQFKHTFTFEGANDRGGLFASFSYLKNNGPVVGDKDNYERFTGNINASYQIKPWMKVGTTAIVERWRTQSVSTSDGWGAMLTSLYALDPMTPVIVTPENLAKYGSVYGNMTAHQGELLGENGNFFGLSQFYTGEQVNPLIMRDRATDKYSGFNVTGSAYVLFNPWKPLTITSRFGYKLGSQHDEHYEVPYFGSVQANSPNVNINARNSTSIYYQWENFANYDQTFNEVHNVTAMVGMSFQKDNYSMTYGAGNTKDGKYAIPVVNFPLWGYLDYVQAGADKNVGGNNTIHTQYSWFARAGYAYDNKYMIQASIRGDAYDSSYLPENNRWGYFPSVSLGWTMSQEDWMGWSRPALDFLKLRLSYGVNGSVAPLGGYNYASVIGPFAASNYGWGQWNNAIWSWNTEGNYSWTNGNGPATMGNPDLKWETMTQWDFGIDARFFNNRLTFGFDYFHKETKDLLVYGIVPTYSIGGVTSPMNAGNVLNEGVEFELGWQDRVGDFWYNVGLNVSTLHNEVTKLHPTVPIINGASFSNIVMTRFEVGEKVWHFYGYDYAGVDPNDGSALYWADRDGKRVQVHSGDLTENDKCNIGDAIPDVTMGLNLALGWKGIDFVLSGAGQFGNQMYMGIQRQDRLTSNRMYDVFYNNRWTADNPGGNIPAAAKINQGADAEHYLFSSAMVFNASFFKIRQIQLGYTLPQWITRKAFVENFRVYVSLDDFFTITNYKGLDPEVSAGTGSSQGLDLGGYPVTKKVSVGFNITF